MCAWFVMASTDPATEMPLPESPEAGTPQMTEPASGGGGEMAEIKIQLQAMQRMIEDMRQELMVEKIKATEEKLKHTEEMMKIKDEVREAKSKKEKEEEEQKTDGKIKSLKDFDYKNVPKPAKYNLDHRGYNGWHDLFVATMSASDPQWEKILMEIEGFGADKITPEKVNQLEITLGMEGEVMKKAQRTLYLHLLQYTEGEAYAKVISGGTKEVIETYRHITYKGKNATIVTRMEKRMRVMNPDPAKDVKDVESKVTAWKGDIRYLQETGDDDKIMLENNDQMITILIGMMPEIVADFLISRYDAGKTTLEDMEKILNDYLIKMGNRDKKRGGKISQVTDEKVEEESTEMEEQWQQKYDDIYGMYWLCTAVPAAKRQRTEENPQQSEIQNGPKGKAKGKGGKGPMGGCHECGDSHYVRDCPIRRAQLEAKGKGKGKGKYAKGNGEWFNVPPRQWGQWNPGFMNRQWSSWRPGGKGQVFNGKGKGESNVSGVMPAGLPFPPLGAVNQQQPNNDEWSCGNTWGSQGNQWSPIFQIVKKNGRKFTKTSMLDHVFHFNDTIKMKNRFQALESEGDESNGEETGDKKEECDQSQRSYLGIREGRAVTVSAAAHGKSMKRRKNEKCDRSRCSYTKEQDELAETAGVVTSIHPTTPPPNHDDHHQNPSSRSSRSPMANEEESSDDMPKMVRSDDESDDEDLREPRTIREYRLENVMSRYRKTKLNLREHFNKCRSSCKNEECCRAKRKEERLQEGDQEDQAPLEEINAKLKKLQIIMRAKVEGNKIANVNGKEEERWRRLAIAVDSGACASVMSPEELPEYKDAIMETKGSRDGDDFVGASGEVIPNYGELKVPLITREQTTRGMTFTAAGVAKPLASVKRMTMEGHMVVFDEEMSYVYNKKTGELNMLREEDGNYMMDVWVPPPEVAKKMGFRGQP